MVKVQSAPGGAGVAQQLPGGANAFQARNLPGMKTVLVIDDDSEIREVLSLFLRQRGWRVFEAGDGQQGLELARQQLPQAILCDLLMPGTNGFSVCAAVRAERALRHCLVVAMSGRGFEDNRRSALEAGADEFLVKPIDPEALLAMLSQMTAAPLAPALTPAGFEGAGEEYFLRFWGVRGSVPVPGPGTIRYGGNTACVEFRAGGEIVILDAGTGIRQLGEALAAEFGEQRPPLTLLVTHAHWDHVQGFPFFKPLYDPAWPVRVLGYESAGESLAAVFSRQMEPPFFPIQIDQLPGHPHFDELGDLTFSVGRIEVQAAFVNHPGVCVGYRLAVDGVTVAYVPDHEPFSRTSGALGRRDGLADESRAFARREDERIAQFLHGVDALILDSQYDAESYRTHVGWGHSSMEDAVELAVRAQAKQLLLFHHDPSHDDERMDALSASARELTAKLDPQVAVEAAREGMLIRLRIAARAAPSEASM